APRRFPQAANLVVAQGPLPRLLATTDEVADPDAVAGRVLERVGAAIDGPVEQAAGVGEHRRSVDGRAAVVDGLDQLHHVAPRDFNDRLVAPGRNEDVAYDALDGARPALTGHAALQVVGGHVGKQALVAHAFGLALPALVQFASARLARRVNAALDQRQPFAREAACGVDAQGTIFAQRAPRRVLAAGKAAVQHEGLAAGSATQDQARHDAVA